jgi:ribosomal-protein-alanine N-acetyltransferase
MFNFDSFPTLRTPRLTLREITLADADAIFRIRGDFAVTRLNIGAAYASRDEAEELIEVMARAYMERSEIRWGITLREAEHDVIGMCGFNTWHQIDRRGAVGFDLAQAYWRRGIMRETLTAILRFGFEEMSLNRVEADASAENMASLGLLESVGFRREGVQREQYWDDGAFQSLELFGLLRAEWRG